MTALPPLKWKKSPNYSNRLAKVDLIVLHDCEGGYQGSISTFLDPRNNGRPVSAHIVLKEDGSEATQMVPFGLKAWHCMAFNSRSIGIEMAGFEAKGFAAVEWREAAVITAYLCHRYGIPIHWAQKGQGPGICRHFDLGKAGGGHVDPTQDPATWTSFLDMVEQESRTTQWPAEPWGYDQFPSGATVQPRHDPPSVPANPVASAPEPSDHAYDSRWLQAALNATGISPPLKVDGKVGPVTSKAIRTFKRANGLPDSPTVDKATIEALEALMAPRRPSEATPGNKRVAMQQSEGA